MTVARIGKEGSRRGHHVGGSHITRSLGRFDAAGHRGAGGRRRSGSIVGIISERDVMAAIADRGAEALSDPVARHMTKNPKMAAEDDTVHSTMETMTIGRFRHLPVIDRGRLVGLVSIGDVVKISDRRYRIRT